MKKLVLLFVIATAMIVIGCGGGTTRTAQAEQPTTSDYTKKFEADKAQAEKSRVDSFKTSLDSFYTESKTVPDRKALETASSTRGWFSIACDLERTVENLNSSAASLTQKTNADLLAQKSLTQDGINATIKPYVETFVFTVAQAAKTQGGSYSRQVGNGCHEGGSADLQSLLISAEEKAYDHQVNVEANGFGKGELRTLIIRETKTMISQKKYFQDMQSNDPQTVENAVNAFMEFMSTIVDLDLTDQELGITPQIREILNKHPNNTSGG